MLEVKHKVPSNKNIEVQRKFFSTKKRKKESNVRLIKPTSEEKDELVKEMSSAVQQLHENHAIKIDDVKQEGIPKAKRCEYTRFVRFLSFLGF